MLHVAPRIACLSEAKNEPKSNAVLPRVCGTRFFNDFSPSVDCDKNDRF
jgi:hypothetical protein